MGSQASGRPGGNPDLEQYQFKTDKDEPCTAKLTLRIAPSDFEKLKTLDNWQEKTRQAIKKLIAE
jgi:hypothetical protein